MASSAEQAGIKWWKHCQVCEWRAKTKGNPQENSMQVCPNCNNPVLSVEIDENVFNEKRYDVRVRNTKGQEIADQVRQDEGRPPAPPDTEDRSDRGHQYGTNPKPFPDP